MNILITGGAGFIGSYTADALIQKGYPVRILDNLQRTVHPEGKPNYLNPNADFMVGDVRDKETLRRALSGVPFRGLSGLPAGFFYFLSCECGIHRSFV